MTLTVHYLERLLMRYDNEGHFRSVLGAKLALFDVEFQPIESGGTANGISDAYFSSRAHHIKGWIELKNEDALPKRGKHKVGYQPGQYSWINRMRREGTLCMLGIAFYEGVVFFSDYEIEKEYTKEQLETRIVDKGIPEQFIKIAKAGVNNA